jgi:hypothetical protein
MARCLHSEQFHTWSTLIFAIRPSSTVSICVLNLLEHLENCKCHESRLTCGLLTMPVAKVAKEKSTMLLCNRLKLRNLQRGANKKTENTLPLPIRFVCSMTCCRCDVPMVASSLPRKILSAGSWNIGGEFKVSPKWNSHVENLGNFTL